ncbi:MAG: carbohydrate binding family 9 domain-containing protein [Candidatus Eisenbacteria bacterium]|nr:carbohydrate binding family 9 domain-containing protein [Candidatus Eisenbacteria bacterium]
MTLVDLFAMRRGCTVVSVGAALVVLAVSAHRALAVEHRTYTTARTETRPHIDGLLDDGAWNGVEWASNFVQREPDEGAAPIGQTEFKITYDMDNLYIAYRAHDPEPQRIGNILGRRDDFPGDWVEINIDSFHDHRTAFSFTASVSGTQGDEFVSEDGDNWDGNWDPIWEFKSRIDDHGWTAEARIPLGQLRYADREEQIWGIQVQRRIYRAEERSVWQQIPKDQDGWVSQFGELLGIRGIRPQRQIELLPYTVGQLERFPRERGNPFADGSDAQISVGLDGKLGVTSDLTADFTINPDFGQVEADPSQVNLTAFETFFEEKRPFFIEGKNIFEYRLAPSIAYGTHTTDRLFYSRRLGRAPHYQAEPPEEGFVDQPGETSILGAIKLTGKTAGGWSVGVLESVAGEELAEIEAPSGKSDVRVEPLTNYFVGRLQRDLRKGNTRIGGLVTAVNRQIENRELRFVHEAAYTGGIDLFHYLADRRAYVALNLVGSSVRGDQEAILATQTAPARYFQRSDNQGQSVDTTRTSLNGHGGSLRIGESNGAFRFQVGSAWRSAGLELNDIGYLRSADEINQFAWMGYAWRNPFFVFRSMELNLNQWLDFEYGGENTYQAVNLNTGAQFRNNWGYNGSVTRENERISVHELRGGPSMRLPGSISADFGFESDGRKPLAFDLGFEMSRSDDGAGSSSGIGGGIGWRPTNAIHVSAGPGYSHNEPEMQFIGSARKDGEIRYLYGAMEQKTFDVSFRIDYSATPNLTVQYYGAPFVSAGSFSNFRRITAPRAERYEDRFEDFGDRARRDPDTGRYRVDEDGDGTPDYQFRDPDFNVRDWNSNLVFRWQYSPGSSLFLVWSQNRSSFAPDGSFSVDRDLDALFGEQPRDVFLVKINRWFDL